MLIPIFKLLWLNQRRKTKYHAILKKLHTLYADTNTYEVAKQANRENSVSTEFVYGEIDPIALLDLLAKIHPHQGVCYDLGSGDGKTLLAIKLCYPQLNVIGIEKIPQLHALAKNKYQAYLEQHKLNERDFSLTHHQQDILNFPFIYADILFINATAFEANWPQILIQLHQLKKGAKIILTTKTLPLDAFTKLYQGMEQMSWGLTSTYIYEKKLLCFDIEGSME